MAEDKSIPADIFEEMAGMKEITPPKSAKSEENVKSETIVTPINEERLFKASIAFVSKVQKKLVKGFYKVAKRIVEIQNDAAPKMPKKQGWNIFAKIIINETPAETSARETSESFNPFTLKLKLIWAGIKLAVGVLFALGKWLFKLAAKITTTILKLFGFVVSTILPARATSYCISCSNVLSLLNNVTNRLDLFILDILYLKFIISLASLISAGDGGVLFSLLKKSSI
jgi:hypothetical protein